MPGPPPLNVDDPVSESGETCSNYGSAISDRHVTKVVFSLLTAGDLCNEHVMNRMQDAELYMTSEMKKAVHIFGCSRQSGLLQ